MVVHTSEWFVMVASGGGVGSATGTVRSPSR